MATTTIRDWHGVREAYRRRELRQALYDGGHAVMSDCLLNLHGVEHRDRRRVENRLFRRETFAQWEHEVLAPTLAATMAPFIKAGEGDLVAMGYRLAMNLTATIAGLDVDPADPAETDALHQIVATLSEGATMAHSTRPEHELQREVEVAMENLDNRFLVDAIERRLALPQQDVLSVLLQHQESLGLSSDAIRREIGFYLQAGAHSTAHALVHAFDELFDWLPGANLTPSLAAQDLALLQRVFYESLRLHPASPIARRRAVEDVELGGVAVAAGDIVELDLVAANRDRTVFGPNADDFDPNRQLPPVISRWGNSFGGGVHSCIGQELDGGVPMDAVVASDGGAAPLYGTVTVMLQELLTLGFVPDTNNPASSLSSSTRSHYGSYPVVRHVG